jgi:hypothetical protein
MIIIQNNLFEVELYFTVSTIKQFFKESVWIRIGPIGGLLWNIQRRKFLDNVRHDQVLKKDYAP